MLETLAGPRPGHRRPRHRASRRCATACRPTRSRWSPGRPGRPPRWRAFAGPPGGDAATGGPRLRDAAETVLAEARRTTAPRRQLASSGRHRRCAWCRSPRPAGRPYCWRAGARGHAAQEETALLEDAAHSLRLALEREEAGLAHQEAAALRRSRELQRGFLSRLSHELRTPLTAIRGYASSLHAAGRDLGPRLPAALPGPHRRRVGPARPPRRRPARLLRHRIGYHAAAARTGATSRWCSRRPSPACRRPGPRRGRGPVRAGLPAVWADHDRLEQVFVNLLEQRVRPQPARHPGAGHRRPPDVRGRDQRDG